MDCKTFEGIHSVDPDVWNRITNGHPYAGWVWCEYGERAVGYKGHYLIVYDGNQPVGGAIFWVMHKESVPTRSRAAQWFFGTYLDRRPLVVCRTAIGTDHKGFFLPTDPDRQAAVLDAVQRRGIELLRQNKGSFLLADYLLDNEVDLAWSSQFFRFKDFMSIGTLMNVEWDTYDDYLLALKTQDKKAHKNIRHNIRYAQEEGITLRFQHEKPPADEVLRLISVKMEHYKFPFDVAQVRQVIDVIGDLPEPNAIWVLAYAHDQMVGCEALLNDEKNRICKPILYGRDYSVEYVYFYLCYEDIRYAIENLGAKTIIYDAEAYDFKRRIGFENDARNNMVFCPNSRLERALVGVLSRFVD